MAEQKRFSFDRETLIKIGKGALISFTGAGALGLLDYLGTLKMDNPFLVSLIAFAVPFLVNVIKEFMAGKKVESPL